MTLFSGAILEVLREGAAGYAEQLSFADIRDAAFEKMVIGFGANAPRPVLHQVNARKGDLTRLKVFPNRAFHPDAAAHGEQVKHDVDFKQRSVPEAHAREAAAHDARAPATAQRTQAEHDMLPAGDHQPVKPEAYAYRASQVNDAPAPELKKDARSKLLLNILSVVLFIVLALLYIVFFSGHL
jgi:hypothetical protein